MIDNDDEEDVFRLLSSVEALAPFELPLSVAVMKRMQSPRRSAVSCKTVSTAILFISPHLAKTLARVAWNKDVVEVYLRPLLEWGSEYAVRIYPTSDSGLTCLFYAQIA